MITHKLYHRLEEIAVTEYKDVVTTVEIINRKSKGSSKLRIHLKDKTYLDVWLSPTKKYSYHWEQRAIRGLIYRHDNAPDFPKIETYPKHVHDGDEKNVKPSNISDEPHIAIREILDHIKREIS